MQLLIIGGTRLMRAHIGRSSIEEGHGVAAFHRGRGDTVSLPEAALPGGLAWWRGIRFEQHQTVNTSRTRKYRTVWPGRDPGSHRGVGAGEAAGALRNRVPGLRAGG